MADEEEAPKKVQYPLDSTAYKILEEVGAGDRAVVYKAVSVPMNSMVVAIKAVDLDRSRHWTCWLSKPSLLSHPNILSFHCSFTVDHRLWMVMSFMSADSLQSIISYSFPDGVSEPCIAILLKETLSALSYIHKQVDLHRGIKASNILIDSNGSVKLADFGMCSWSDDSVPGTAHWMALEADITPNCQKTDIWSFGINALELAHGRPPLSNVSENHDKHEKFSKAFKDMVASCLHQDPLQRPSAETLLKHSFFENCKGTDFLVKNVLQGLPSVEERFKESKMSKNIIGDEGGGSARQSIKETRMVSGWSFNEERFELDPVFPTESTDDSVVKQVGDDNCCDTIRNYMDLQ